MEISSAVLSRTQAVSRFPPLRDSISADGPSASSTVSFARTARTTRASARSRGLSAAFSEAGHLKYYAQPVRCGGGRTKEEKKRKKLLKGLSKDLAALRLVGVGADAAEGFAGDINRKKITKAGELLMAELKRLGAQEREIKKKNKEDRKAAKKASKMKRWAAMDDSSSSSSESSDDECGNKVLRMSNLRTTALPELDPETLQIALTTPKTEEVAGRHIALCKNTAAAAERSSSNVFCSNSSGTTSAAEMSMDKIEVCMGGKCKKSGATELMEEFSKKIGHGGAVVGCKCMGKCRDGPNVRISAATVAPKNRLCIGVGLEDVGTIVANFFGEKDAGVIPA